MAKENVYLESKPRYEILDGLRGVAAVMVVIFHLFETYSNGPAAQIVNHGYLAVDFFFVLSGFVIGYAYDDRWGNMTTWGFFKRRLVRLHPMLILGTIIGAAVFFLSDCEVFPMASTVTWQKFLICFVLGLFAIPCGKNLDIRGWGEVNSFNGPVWTLTFEYIGNILYALILRRLPKIGLAVLLVAAGFLTLNLTLDWDVFNMWEEHKFNVIGGWSLAPEQLMIGFTRLLYPFICGLLISRILSGRATEKNPGGSPLSARGGFWWCSLIMVVILAMPCLGGRQCFADGLYQAVSIMIIFPAIVLLGAGSTTTGKTAKLCKFLGDLSFPLYLTHYPFMYMQMSWAWTHKDAPMWMHVMVSLGILLLSLGVAWASFKLYDQPVRKWLTEKWLKKKSRQITE